MAHRNVIKIWLGADVLRSKTVTGIYKELYARVSALNLVRWLMVRAAKTHKQDPLRISVSASIRLIACYSTKMSAAPIRTVRDLYNELMEKMALSIVPYRPGRVEPRARKRRARSFKELKINRTEWRCINGVAA